MKKSVKDAFYKAQDGELDDFLKEIEIEGGLSHEITSRIKKRVEEKTGVELVRRKTFFKPWVAAVACLCIAVAVSLSVEYINFESDHGVLMSEDNLQSEAVPNVSEENSEENSESDFQSSEDVSNDELKSSEDDSADEITSSEAVSDIVSTSDLKYFPSGTYKIVYGENTVPKIVNSGEVSEFVNSMSLFFESEATQGDSKENTTAVYYYVCIDVRNSSVYSEDDFLNELLKLRIKAKKIDYGIFVSYVTENQVKAIEKEFNEGDAFKGIRLRLSCVAKDFVEEWMTETNR